MTLEERITRLEDIEAIRQLQARYQRCLDTRDFEALEQCFTDDVDAAYDNAHESYRGKEAVMNFLRTVMTTDIPSSHLIHGGEIDVESPTIARAKWYLEDLLFHRKFLVKLHGTAIYDVEYQKQAQTPQPPKGGESVDVSLTNSSPSLDNQLSPFRGLGGLWRISKIGYTRCYEYIELRGIFNLLTFGKTTFLDRFKKKQQEEGAAQGGGLLAHIRHFTKK